MASTGRRVNERRILGQKQVESVVLSVKIEPGARTEAAVHPVVTDIETKRRERAARKAATAKPEVQVSEEAKRRVLADEAVRNAPDVRADKVHRLKMKVQNDAFRVDSTKIAERLIDDL